MSEPQRSDGGTRRLPVIEKADDTADATADGRADDREPDQSASAAAYDPLPVLDGENGREKRFWSARRTPAGILAVLLLAGAGLFLYDVAAVSSPSGPSTTPGCLSAPRSPSSSGCGCSCSP